VSARRSSWRRAPRGAAPPLLFAGGELAWAFLWLGWFCHLAFVRLNRPAFSWPLAALILGLALAVTHRSMGSGDRVGANRRAAIMILATGAVTIIAATWLSFGVPAPRLRSLIDLPDVLGNVPGVDVALAFGVYLWWRGIAIARNPLHFEDATTRLAFGAAALVAGLALGGASGSTIGAGATVLLAVEFFACTLPALALARLEDIRRDRVADSAGLALSREWLGVLGLVVLGILLLAAVLTAAVSRDAERLIAMALNTTADALLVVVYVVLLPVGLLVWGAVIVGQFLVGLFSGGHVQSPPPPISTEPFGQQPAAGTTHLPVAVTAIGKWLLLALVVAAVATVILRAVFRYQRSRGVEVEEVHESIWPGGSLWLALWAWLRALIGRLRRHKAPSMQGLAIVEDASHSAEAASVRAIYRRWLVAAASLGRGRRPQETPNEFLSVGRELLPMAGAELAVLTHAYETARYAASSGEAQLSAARAAWHRIEEYVPGAPQRLET
jgi:hypothetical protein